MPSKMKRGKQQILLNYLPGSTFDFERNGVIARVDHIYGTLNTQMNGELILNAVSDYASSWSEDHRPTLRNDVLRELRRFALIDPKQVNTTIFPSVFWCKNQDCGRVSVCPDGEIPDHTTCQNCASGLVQMRFVQIHRCGALQPLSPRYCSDCNSSSYMALDTRGSERLTNFRWRCLQCGRTFSVFGGRCRECNWTTEVPGVDNPENYNIEVHRSGRTFYPHYVVLLNQPTQELAQFFAIEEWQQLAGAMFLELPEVSGMSFTDFCSKQEQDQTQKVPSIRSDEDELRAKGVKEEDIKKFLEMKTLLETPAKSKEDNSSPSTIAKLLVERTGVPITVWQNSGREILEAVLPSRSATKQQVLSLSPEASDDSNSEVSKADSAKKMGIESITLVADFPVTIATFGFSRVDYQPNRCQLNPFPPDQNYEGRFPIFVDLVQADAILVRLDYSRVWKWLELNGCAPKFPVKATDPDLAKRAYFINLLNDVPLRETLRISRLEERMVFGLLHTLSHLAVRRAALLCGLDMTSISEYILPRTLTFALYCNHRFGATIGALSSLFEQSLEEWLGFIQEAESCIYDPVCNDGGGSCHACTHLAETSCRFFNLNLGRSFLFGGYDPELGDIHTGYFNVS